MVSPKNYLNFEPQTYCESSNNRVNALQQVFFYFFDEYIRDQSFMTFEKFSEKEMLVFRKIL